MLNMIIVLNIADSKAGLLIAAIAAATDENTSLKLQFWQSQNV